MLIMQSQLFINPENIFYVKNNRKIALLLPLPLEGFQTIKRTTTFITYFRLLWKVNFNGRFKLSL